MHQWTKQDCDDGFFNDMLDECTKAHAQTRKKRHIEDFMPLLRHKYKRVTLDDVSNQNLYHMWHTVCQWAAGKDLSMIVMKTRTHVVSLLRPKLCF